MTDDERTNMENGGLTEPDAAHTEGMSFPAKTTTDPARVRTFAVDCAVLLLDDKCKDVVVLDVRAMSQVTSYVVVATGASDRQMNSALDHADDLGAERGFESFRTSKDDRSTWILSDFVDVVVHLFEPNTRAYYDLEMLWGDAERVDWLAESGRGEKGPGA